MRLRPLEIKVSVNYARLSINIARLANTLKLCRRGRGTGALRDFNPAYDRSESKAERLAVSIFSPVYPHEQTSSLPFGSSETCRLCCKSILSISARNIDSRSGWNAQQRFKRTGAPIR